MTRRPVASSLPKIWNGVRHAAPSRSELQREELALRTKSEPTRDPLSEQAAAAAQVPPRILEGLYLCLMPSNRIWSSSSDVRELEHIGFDLEKSKAVEMKSLVKEYIFCDYVKRRRRALLDALSKIAKCLNAANSDTHRVSSTTTTQTRNLDAPL